MAFHDRDLDRLSYKEYIYRRDGHVLEDLGVVAGGELTLRYQVLPSKLSHLLWSLDEG